MFNLFSTALQPMAIVGIVLASVASLGALIFGFGYLWSRFIAGKSQQQSDASELGTRLDGVLKDLLTAQDIKFKNADELNRANLAKISKLQGMVEEQSRQQKWFEGIFIAALDKFFKDNPALPAELTVKLKRGRKNSSTYA